MLFLNGSRIQKNSKEALPPLNQFAIKISLAKVVQPIPSPNTPNQYAISNFNAKSGKKETTNEKFPMVSGS